MKRLLALIFVVLVAGCGSEAFDQVFTLDDSQGSSRPYDGFGGTVVWEYGKETKPWGIIDSKLVRLNWDNKVTDVVFEPPRTLSINKNIICDNLVKEIYATGKNQALYMVLSQGNYWLLFFNGKVSKRILAEPVNGAVVSTIDTLTPASCIKWDPWNEKFIFVAAIGTDTNLQIFTCSTDGTVKREGSVQTLNFLPTPVDGFIIEKTSDPLTVGDLVDTTGRRMILRNCFARNVPGTKQAYFLSERKVYTFDGINLTQIGKMAPTDMPKWFGIVDGKPFTLLNIDGLKYRISFFGQ